MGGEERIGWPEKISSTEMYCYIGQGAKKKKKCTRMVWSRLEKKSASQYNLARHGWIVVQNFVVHENNLVLNLISQQPQSSLVFHGQWSMVMYRQVGKECQHL